MDFQWIRSFQRCLAASFSLRNELPAETKSRLRKGKESLPILRVGDLRVISMTGVSSDSTGNPINGDLGTVTGKFNMQALSRQVLRIPVMLSNKENYRVTRPPVRHVRIV